MVISLLLVLPYLIRTVDDTTYRKGGSYDEYEKHYLLGGGMRHGHLHVAHGTLSSHVGPEERAKQLAGSREDQH